MTRLPLLLIVFVLSVSCVDGLAQRVLYNSQTLNQPDTERNIRNVRPNWALSPNITVIYADGQTEKVNRDSIWGYEDRRKRVYRYFKNSFYRVVTNDEVVKYRQMRNTGRGIASIHYFSNSLDSPIRWTKQKAQKDVGNSD